MTTGGSDPVALAGDGCTGWFDGTWRGCCDAHDLAYAMQLDRLQADIALGWCVAQHGHPVMGLLMLVGVAAFGGALYALAGRRAATTTRPCP